MTMVLRGSKYSRSFVIINYHVFDFFTFFSYRFTTRQAASVLLSCSFGVKGKNHVVIVYVICYATRMLAADY